MRIIQPLLSETEEAALNRVLDYLADEAKEYEALPLEERKNHIYEAVLALRATVLHHHTLAATPHKGTMEPFPDDDDRRDDGTCLDDYLSQAPDLEPVED